MCIEDVRLGRKTGAGVSMVTAVDGAWVLLVPHDPNRVSLIFARNASTAYQVRIRGSGYPDDPGFSVGDFQSAILLNIRDHGALVTEDWEVFVSGSSPVMSAYWTNLQEQ